MSTEYTERFAKLSTPLVADACDRLDVTFRVAETGIHPIELGTKLCGRVLPSRHFGSIDIFMEAMTTAQPGDVLVIDNEMRMDEGCIGDLIALEARAWGVAGIIVRGCCRDSEEIRRIKYPVFCYGTLSAGPRRVVKRSPDALVSASFGDFRVTQEDFVFADDDGVIFLPAARVDEVLTTAENIYEVERKQAEMIASGVRLYEQFDFGTFLKKRQANPDYTFRQHLRQLGGAIEE
jgi:4-hydroxy-4-methyl-2-oxoglutarate aldolase